MYILQNECTMYNASIEFIDIFINFSFCICELHIWNSRYNKFVSIEHPKSFAETRIDMKRLKCNCNATNWYARLRSQNKYMFDTFEVYHETTYKRRKCIFLNKCVFGRNNLQINSSEIIIRTWLENFNIWFHAKMLK